MADQSQEVRDRKYPRVKESCQVKYQVVKDAPTERPEQGGIAVNISGGGMCLSSDEAIELGSMMTLEMTLSHLPTPVMALGRVVWCEPSAEPGKFDVGVEFWWVGWADAEAQNQMLGYISKKLDELGVDHQDDAT